MRRLRRRDVFAANRFVDFVDLSTEVGGEFIRRLAGDEALEDFDCGDPRSVDHRTSKGEALWIQWTQPLCEKLSVVRATGSAKVSSLAPGVATTLPRRGHPITRQTPRCRSPECDRHQTRLIFKSEHATIAAVLAANLRLPPSDHGGLRRPPSGRPRERGRSRGFGRTRP